MEKQQHILEQHELCEYEEPTFLREEKRCRNNLTRRKKGRLFLLNVDLILVVLFDYSSARLFSCCCFSTGTLQGDECSRTGLCRYHPTAQLHLGSLREPWVTLLLHLYWRGCLIIHVSGELAGSYLEHVPCKFWKVCLGLKYLPRINNGGH